ncbi:hypothetical protein EZS27_035813 [termite gut metagenome]|uniref:Uncharacterized protein n=1 Tax=termite gut metagenome TaxID=433724 RepID=A0A5J4PXM6_9ZZZZ
METGITLQQMDALKCAIGYRPYRVENGIHVSTRNWCGYRQEMPFWEDLVVKGYATKRLHRLFNETVYSLSESGIKYLENVLSVKIKIS